MGYPLAIQAAADLISSCQIAASETSGCNDRNERPKIAPANRNFLSLGWLEAEKNSCSRQWQKFSRGRERDKLTLEDRGGRGKKDGRRESADVNRCGKRRARNFEDVWMRGGVEGKKVGHHFGLESFRLVCKIRDTPSQPPSSSFPFEREITSDGEEIHLQKEGEKDPSLTQAAQGHNFYSRVLSFI